MTRQPLSERARGRWRALLPLLGIETRFLTGKHGPCPMCGGKDRWRFTDKAGAGTWICNQCGHGTGTDLVMKLRGIDFKAAAELIECHIGKAPAETPKAEPSAEENRAAMAAMWRKGVAVTPSCIVGRYLAARGVGIASYPAALRYCAAPLMMLAQVISPEGRAVNVHRTFLAEPGVKAAMAQPRLMMRGETPLGSAIRLAKITDGVLGIAEGIETALSAATLFDLPVWALISADNLAAFVPPEGVMRLIIFGDNDENHHGQWAAETAARVAHRQKIAAETRFPDKAGEDWNDILLHRGKAA